MATNDNIITNDGLDKENQLHNQYYNVPQDPNAPKGSYDPIKDIGDKYAESLKEDIKSGISHYEKEWKDFWGGFSNHKEWVMGAAQTSLVDSNDTKRKYYNDRRNVACFKAVMTDLAPYEAFWQMYGYGKRFFHDYEKEGLRNGSIGVPIIRMNTFSLNQDHLAIDQRVKIILNNNNITVHDRQFKSLGYLDIANAMDSEKLRLWKLTYAYILQEFYEYDLDTNTFTGYNITQDTSAPYYEDWSIPRNQIRREIPTSNERFGTQGIRLATGTIQSITRCYTVYGPYIQFPADVYHFTYVFDSTYSATTTITDSDGNLVTTYDPIGVMDIVCDFGLTTLARVEIPHGLTRITLSNIRIPAKITNLEVRFYSYGGTVNVYKLIVAKKKRTFVVDWDQTGFPIWYRSFHQDENFTGDRIIDDTGKITYLPRPMFARTKDGVFVNDIPSLNIAEKINDNTYSDFFTWNIVYPDGTPFRPPNTAKALYTTEGLTPPSDFETSYWFINYTDNNTKKGKMLVYRGAKLPMTNNEISDLENKNDDLSTYPIIPVMEWGNILMHTEEKKSLDKFLKKIGLTLESLTDSFTKQDYEAKRLNATAYWLYMAMYSYNNVATPLTHITNFTKPNVLNEEGKGYDRSQFYGAILDFIDCATEEELNKYIYNLHEGFTEAKKRTYEEYNNYKLRKTNNWNTYLKEKAKYVYEKCEGDAGCSLVVHQEALEDLMLKYVPQEKRAQYERPHNNCWRCDTGDAGSDCYANGLCIANTMHTLTQTANLFSKDNCYRDAWFYYTASSASNYDCSNTSKTFSHTECTGGDDAEVCTNYYEYGCQSSSEVATCDTLFNEHELTYTQCIEQCAVTLDTGEGSSETKYPFECVSDCFVDYSLSFDPVYDSSSYASWRTAYETIERIEHWDEYTKIFADNEHYPNTRTKLRKYIQHCANTTQYYAGADSKLGFIYFMLGVNPHTTYFQNEWRYDIPRDIHGLMTPEERQQVKANNALAGDEYTSLLLYWTLVGYINQGGGNWITNSIKYRGLDTAITFNVFGPIRYEGVVDLPGHAHHYMTYRDWSGQNVRIKWNKWKPWKPPKICFKYWTKHEKKFNLFYQEIKHKKDDPDIYYHLHIARISNWYGTTWHGGLSCTGDTYQEYHFEFCLTIWPWEYFNQAEDFYKWTQRKEEGYLKPEFLLPISRSAVKRLQMLDQVKVYQSVLYMSTIGFDYTTVYWYQSSAMKWIIAIVIVVIGIIVSIFGTPAAGAAYWAAVAKPLLLIFILNLVTPVVMGLLNLTSWSKWVKTIVYAIFIIVVSIITQDWSKLTTLATAVEVANIAMQAVTAYLGFEIQEQALEFEKDIEALEEKKNELDTVEASIMSGLDISDVLEMLEAKNNYEALNESLKSAKETSQLMISQETRMYMIHDMIYDYDQYYAGVDNAVRDYYKNAYTLII